MKMVWLDDLAHIRMEFSNGAVREWDATLWRRAGKAVNSGIYKAWNDYWVSQPATKVKEVEAVYLEVFDLFDQFDLEVSELNQKLRKYVDKLFGYYNWNNFRAWCMINGGMYLANGIKDSLDEKDKAGLTYFTKDYEDLMVFSIMLKSVMPIWGLYERNFKKEFGRYHILINTADLIRVPNVLKLDPYKKLESYIDCFSSEPIKSDGFSLSVGVGSEEVPALLMAQALIKKVIIYDVSHPDYSIVTNIYHLLNERYSDISKGKPNQKHTIDEEKSDITITDQYKIVQRVPPAISVMVDHYASNPEVVAKHIEPNVTLTAVRKYVKAVGKGMTLSNFHIPILALVTKDVINPGTLRVATYLPLCSLIASTAAVLETWNMVELSELITTEPQEKDIYQVTLSSTSNRSFNQLRPDLTKELDALYPYRSIGQQNPGQLLIEAVIKEVLKSDWDIDAHNFVDIRNTLAMLILKTGANRPCPSI